MFPKGPWASIPHINRICCHLLVSSRPGQGVMLTLTSAAKSTLFDLVLAAPHTQAWLTAIGVDVSGLIEGQLPTPRAWQLFEEDGRRTQVGAPDPAS